MIIGGYQNLWKLCYAGDKVWACAFQISIDKNSKRFKQEPVYGMLTVTDAPDKEIEYRQERMRQTGEGRAHASYFVPFKKDGKSLAYSKAVQVSARCYATTQEECVEMYNKMIQKYIDWYKKEIMELEGQKLR